MATNLAIDDALLSEALRLSGHATKKATVNEALHDILRRKQRGIVKLFGKIDVNPDYEDKQQRNRK